jgi:5-hydroxyisourate hydrolase
LTVVQWTSPAITGSFMGVENRLMKAGGISLHAVDVVSGRAAAGLAVAIDRVDPSQARIAEGLLGAGGTLDHPVVDGAGVDAGVYVARFLVRAFYARMSVACPFLDIVEFRFEISDPREHVHLPLKFSPWGLALFRGV